MSQVVSPESQSTTRPHVAFVTMGCAKNEVDTEKMKSRLSDAGYRCDDDVSTADVIVVNTCSFIQDATEESLEMIFDMADLDCVASGNTKIVVAGCMPARYGSDLEEELTEASSFVPCARECDIVEVVDECLGLDRSALPDAGSIVEPEPSADDEVRTFAYVKISDGCDRWCSYCTIPLIRGRYHSFPYDSIRDDVSYHVRHGVKEIDLIAQDTGRWGTDFDDPSSLAELLSRLAEEFPETWFRVMYLQPEGVTDEVLNAMREHDNICSYLDIPLQHVNERILREMNRSGSRTRFEELVNHVRDLVPDVTLRTTLIAGFPGETEAMFQRGNCRARVAYLNGSDQLNMPPVELIQFVGDEVAHKAADLFTTSISELCFYADDADAVYQKLMEQGVECLSSPQEFDFRHDGFGRSRAFYFRDPDGIILEIMQPLDD